VADGQQSLGGQLPAEQPVGIIHGNPFVPFKVKAQQGQGFVREYGTPPCGMITGRVRMGNAACGL
jgi:hypothetical protein